MSLAGAFIPSHSCLSPSSRFWRVPWSALFSGFFGYEVNVVNFMRNNGFVDCCPKTSEGSSLCFLFRKIRPTAPRRGKSSVGENKETTCFFSGECQRARTVPDLVTNDLWPARQ